MKRLRATYLLLALAFALGQWFALTHSTQHELKLGDKSVACEMCAVSHASGMAPAVAVTPTGLPATDEIPASLRVAAPLLRLIRRPPTRGPPASLA